MTTELIPISLEEALDLPVGSIVHAKYYASSYPNEVLRRDELDTNGRGWVQLSKGDRVNKCPISVCALSPKEVWLEVYLLKSIPDNPWEAINKGTNIL